ncbi:MAG: nucleotidyltransferase family protein [Deltaproteobacteria bacterium]|nr:nucleotidyltransferase family protein [Deltaproteobacteria bacterium]
MSGVAGLLLAAGASSRMGAPKQMLSAGGPSLLHRMVLTTLNSHLDLVVLVLGFEARKIREALPREIRDPRLRIVENPEYSRGISSSIIAGLSEVEALFDHVMIVLADMPYITSETINRLLRGYLASGLALGAIGRGKRRMHPVIIGRRFYPQLHRITGDCGARGLFQKFRQEVCIVEPDVGYRDTDIDTPEDYLAFRNSLEREKDP